jgi:CHAT domain-containing protein
VTYPTALHQSTLLGADRSLAQIKKNYKAADVLTGSTATRQQFLARLPFFKIIQLYTHADADSQGREPVLYLSDSILYLSEIQTISQVNTDLIVLSACNTGVGKNVKGEGVYSLARAFAAVGIPCTLTSLWKIDNQATYQLTEAFYKYLSTGLTKDEALQKAKLDFLSTAGAEKSLPYYWAANILLGNTDSYTAEKKEQGLTRYGAALMGLLLLLLFLKLAFWKRGIGH